MATTSEPASDGKPSALDRVASWTSGAVGAGLVLVVAPSAALFFGLSYIDVHPGSGLPLVVIFGIMILVGSLVMASTLFRRLGLARRSQPLALPPGSVRATIALALIVLFAILAISMQRDTATPYEIKGLTSEAKNDLLRDDKLRIVGGFTEPCAPQSILSATDLLHTSAWHPTISKDCPKEDLRYTVVVQATPSAAAIDIAKQLLGLIGNLMTMAVSFYFAARTAAKPPTMTPVVSDAPAKQPPSDLVPSPAPPVAPPAASPPTDHDLSIDGCNVIVTNPTADQELPAAKGGVMTT